MLPVIRRTVAGLAVSILGFKCTFARKRRNLHRKLQSGKSLVCTFHVKSLCTELLISNHIFGTFLRRKVYYPEQVIES